MEINWLFVIKLKFLEWWFFWCLISEIKWTLFRKQRNKLGSIIVEYYIGMEQIWRLLIKISVLALVCRLLNRCEKKSVVSLGNFVPEAYYFRMSFSYCILWLEYYMILEMFWCINNQFVYYELISLNVKFSVLVDWVVFD